jgi:hypothetical protein
MKHHLPLRLLSNLKSALVFAFFAVFFCPAGAQTTPRPSAANSAAAAAARAPQPATAGLLLSQADALRVLAGYWRVQWASDEVQIGILHITAVGASENQVLFEGQYSPDGLNICATTGNWTYNSRVAYSANGSNENYEIANLMRMKLSCPAGSKEYNIETVVVVGNPAISFVGRALISQANRRLTTAVTISRFSAAN